MQVLLRADADQARGTGHVMRLLTLAEELKARGHEVELLGSLGSVDWLETAVAAAGIPVRHCAPDSLPLAEIAALQPDWVVVDSYTIAPEQINQLSSSTRCLAVIDGDGREIEAALYLDQNLGASPVRIGTDQGVVLAGHEYSLVRSAVTRHRSRTSWRYDSDEPVVTVFLGGTDPTGEIIHLGALLGDTAQNARVQLVCSSATFAEASALAQRYENLTAIPPTPELPSILGNSNIVVSAAGTSAWDLCTMAIPSVFVAVVQNQRSSLRNLMEAGLALGVDLVETGPAGRDSVGIMVARLIDDEALRHALAERCLEVFDGEGKARVATAMERAG